MQVEMDREIADINVGRISNKTNGKMCVICHYHELFKRNQNIHFNFDL